MFDDGQISPSLITILLYNAVSEFVSVSKRPRHSPYPMVSVQDAQSIIHLHAVKKKDVLITDLQGKLLVSKNYSSSGKLLLKYIC